MMEAIYFTVIHFYVLLEFESPCILVVGMGGLTLLVGFCLIHGGSLGPTGR